MYVKEKCDSRCLDSKVTLEEKEYLDHSQGDDILFTVFGLSGIEKKSFLQYSRFIKQ